MTVRASMTPRYGAVLLASDKLPSDDKPMDWRFGMTFPSINQLCWVVYGYSKVSIPMVFVVR